MITLTRPLAFLDCESTGLDPQTDRILTLAVEIHLPDDPQPHSQEWKFNPGIPIPPSSTAIHGITDEMAKDWPSFASKAEIIRDRLIECDFGGFNTCFDLQCVTEELNRIPLPFDISDKHILDVGMIYKKQYPRTLSSAVQHYLGHPHDGAHGAAADTLATREIFEVMCLMHDCLNDKSLPEAAHYSLCDDRDGSIKLDLAGMIAKRKDGVVVFNTKRNRGVPVSQDKSYADWMLRTAMPANTHQVLRKVLEVLS